MSRLRAVVALAGLAVCALAGAQQNPNSKVLVTSTGPDGKPIVRTFMEKLSPQDAAALANSLNTFFPTGSGISFSTAALRGPFGTGAAAAGGGSRWNIWGAASYSRTGYSFQPLQSSGNIGVLSTGVDYRLQDNLLLGVALAADRSRTNLEFVAGGGSLAGDGYTIAPYLGYVIDRAWSADASVGYGVTRNDVSGGGLTGSFRGSRTFGTVGLNYRYDMPGSRWLVTGRAALLSASTRTGSYTLGNTFVDGSSTSISQLRLGGQVGYLSGTVVPYVGLSYVYDINRPGAVTLAGQTSSNDRDAWIPAIGLRFGGAGSAYGSLQLSSERGRSQVKNDQLLFNVGVRF